MKAIIYTRVSTEEQTTNYSLANQEESCREFAKRKDWEVIRVFKEEGESGTWLYRTQLQKLLEYCRKTKKEPKILVIHNLDRFARDVKIHFTVKTILTSYKVSLCSVTQPLDDTAEGEFMETVFAGKNQYESRIIGRRAKEGLRKRFESGLWAWCAPMGYKNAQSPNGQKVLIPDPEIAPHITFAFKEYAKGIYAKAQIAKKLKRRLAEIKRKRKSWPQLVDKILKNKFYAGIMVCKKWNKEKRGVHEPLIDMATFTKVQLILQGKSVAAVPRVKCRPEYPLRGFIKCPECQHFLTASQSRGKGGKYSYYHCYAKPRHGSSYPKQEVEDDFVKYLNLAVPDENSLKLFRAVVIDLWETKKKETGTDRKRLDDKLSELEEARSGTIALIRKKTIRENEGRTELDKIRGKIDLVNLERSEMKNDGFNVGTAVDKCNGVLKKPCQFWQNLESVEQKQRFQSLIFPDGVIYENPGFRTQKMGLLFKLISTSGNEKSLVVSRQGFEP